MQTVDQSRCAGCGGQLAAIHLLTRTYPLDTAGRWQRRLTELLATESVVVVCARCGGEPPGTVHACQDGFTWSRHAPA